MASFSKLCRTAERATRAITRAKQEETALAEIAGLQRGEYARSTPEYWDWYCSGFDEQKYLRRRLK